MKPSSTGTFYRPPNINNFLETFFNDLKHIDLHKNEVYFLRDFNVNLLRNDKFILKENQSCDFRNLSSPLLSKYKKLCQTFSLKKDIWVLTRVTSNTSSLLDHIVTNAGWTISQKGVIEAGLSDRQLIYCTQKILRTKANQIRIPKLKNYTPELLKEKLTTKINFPDYNIFSNVNIACLDLVKKILSVIDKITPYKDLRIKSNTQDWFNDKVAEAIKLREKRLKNFKSTKLQIQ